jgi:hypothetical protein
MSRHYYFAAEDLPEDGELNGLITFHFACYGAGTPNFDRFAYAPGQRPRQIAAKPFFAQLPKRMLTHSSGAALACVGHIERAWGSSFVSAGDEQLIPFKNFLRRVMKGVPVGYAIRDFSDRYATLNIQLASILDPDGRNAQIDSEDVISLWRERNDAESYVLVGDPAVRLRVEDME